MQVASFPPQRARAQYRHELRTLTYVTLDEENGGIVRNLSHEGVAVQAVGGLRQDQRVRLRFDLRFPRLRVDTRGQVSWANAAGQCGIQFVDLPAELRVQIDEWIFSNLLASLAREVTNPRSIFGPSVISIVPEENDGLVVSTPPRLPIAMHPLATEANQEAELSWLSRPLSARTLTWIVDSLILTAGLLLFALIFLSIAHELPEWQLTLSGALAAAVFVAGAYWTLFAVIGGPSLGARLAQAATKQDEEHERDSVNRLR